MATQIKFGTSGWRAIVAEEFTFENVRRAVHGDFSLCRCAESEDAESHCGPRSAFSRRNIVEMAADVLSTYQITPLVIAEAAPTPAISYAVTQAKADGAINFTASHNPPEYNGIKFSTPDGAPALPEATKAIEAEIAAYDQGGTRQRPGPTQASKAESQSIDPRRNVSFAVARNRGLRRHQEGRTESCVRSPLGRGRADIPTRSSASPALRSRRSTTLAMFSLAVMLPSLTIICSKTSATKCERSQPASASPPMETPTASASSTRTVPSCSRTTSSRCCSIIWWKAAAGGMA